VLIDTQMPGAPLAGQLDLLLTLGEARLLLRRRFVVTTREKFSNMVTLWCNLCSDMLALQQSS